MISSNLINKILQTALDNGGDFAEVFVEDKYNTNITVNNDIIDNGIVAKEYGVGIRAFSKNNYVYTYSSNDSEENLLKITKEVCKAFNKNGAISSVNEFVKLPQITQSFVEAERYFSKTLYKQKMDLVNRVISSGRAYDESIKRMVARYLDQELLRALSFMMR